MMAFIAKGSTDSIKHYAEILVNIGEKAKALKEYARVLGEAKSTNKFEIRAFVSGGSNVSVTFDLEESEKFSEIREIFIKELEKRVKVYAEELGY